MHTRNAIRISLIFLVSAVAAGGAAHSGADPAQDATRPKIELGGVWRLNRDLTPAPPRGEPGLGEEGRGGGRLPPGGMGGEPGGIAGGMGRPGGGMGRGGGMGSRSGAGMETPEERRRARELVREVTEAPAELIITLGDGIVTFTDHEGRVKRYATTGKKEKHQMDAGVVETSTRWDKDALVLSFKGGNGVKVTRTYTLAPEGRQLWVEVKVENPRMPRSAPLRHVYDPAMEAR